jgi:GNAT superfamily N-acetyltransferase
MTTPRLRIRRVSVEAAVPVLAALHTLTFPVDEAPAWQPSGASWVAYSGPDPVAFLYAEALSPTLWYFSRVGVLPSMRGKGLQARLMDHLERACRGTMLVSTTYENPASANRFVARRWKTYIPVHRWGAAGTIYWYKDLQCSAPASSN